MVFEANQTRMVFVPAGAEEVRVSLSWPVMDATKRIVGTLGFKIDTDSNGGWDYESSVSPDMDGTRTETIGVSGNDDQYWTFGIEGHGIKWHRLFEQQQFQEARIEYEMAVSITFGQGFGTIEVPPLAKGAVVADLKFAQPTQEYTMGNISMWKPVYNLNAIEWEPHEGPPVIPDSGSSGLGWWLLLLLILILLVVAFFIAKQQPDSVAGRRIRHYYAATGAAKVVGRSKGIVRGMRGRVVSERAPEPEVVKAEVVEEAKKEPKKAPAKKAPAKKAGTKKAATKKATAKKKEEDKPAAAA